MTKLKNYHLGQNLVLTTDLGFKIHQTGRKKLRKKHSTDAVVVISLQTMSGKNKQHERLNQFGREPWSSGYGLRFMF